MSERARRAPHLPELDGVRGIAIAAVMALHFVRSQIVEPTSRVESVLARITGYGDWGVDLFFVLSGFLITGILWDSRGEQGYFKTFYARRTLRIFPLYYGVLAVFALLPAGFLADVAPRALETQELQGWLWSYLGNVYLAPRSDFAIPYLSHFWTLAIEEHFYLAWPFVVGLLERKTVVKVCVAVSLAAVALRIGVTHAYPTLLAARVLTPCRLDALCIGAYLALEVRGEGGFDAAGARARVAIAAAACGVLATSVWHVLRPAALDAEPVRLLFLALFFGYGIVLASWSGGPRLLKGFLCLRSLRWLGKYSYGLYVYHGIVAYAFSAHGTLPTFERLAGGHLAGVLLQACVGTAASILLAVSSYELFESRFLRLKKRYEARPARALDEAPAHEPAP